MSPVETISAVAAKKGLEKVISDIYDTSKGQIKLRLKRWKAQKNINVIHTKIKNIRKVKTILQPEKAVDLLKFYYPCKIKQKNNRVTIRDISHISLDGNIVIKGTVGQGKSIFFRYLASREMLKGKRVPLFVELRRTQKGEKLLNHLVEEAEALGLRGIDTDTLLWLAEEGKVVLLLDAFDEVPESERMRITNEIENLAKKYENMQILISSRPNSGIENSPFFQVFDLAPLEGKDYEEAIKVMAEGSVAENIIKAIRSSQSPVRSLLTTPLMVALLIVRHRIEQSFPENLIGFYQGLFALLISRHDKIKGGYTRKRKSGLGDSALEDVFNGVCFLTRRERKGNFRIRELAKYAKLADKLTGHKANEDDVINDIMKITCLILEEGGECKFIHRSVQEYHAACFIKEQPDSSSRKFYEHALDKWRDWNQELDFLMMVDKYRFCKWFLVPDILRVLNLKDIDISVEWEPKPKEVLRVFRGGVFSIDKKGKLQSYNFGSLLNSYILEHCIIQGGYLDIIFEVDYLKLVKEIENNKLALSTKTKIALGGEDVYRILFEEIYGQVSMKKELTKAGTKYLKYVHKQLLETKTCIENVEARKEIFEF